MMTERQAPPVVSDYQEQLDEIVSQVEGGEITPREGENKHKELLAAAALLAFLAGLKSEGVDEPDAGERAIIAAWIAEQSTYVSGLMQAAASAQTEDERQAIRERIIIWAAALGALYEIGRMSAQKNMMLTLDGRDGKKSCKDCQRLKGKWHRAKWWIENRLVPSPGNPNYECGNWPGHCFHYLRDRAGNRYRI
jgi:hypothetical protein